MIDKQIKTLYNTFIATDRLYAYIASKDGLTDSQASILYYLYNNENVYQKKICDDLLLSKQTVNTILSKWEKEEYLFYVEASSKRKYIKFTDNGVKVLVSKIEKIINIEKKAFAMLESNQEMFVKLNEEYLKNLKEVSENE